MGKYFKLIGVIGLICTIAGIIYYAITLFRGLQSYPKGSEQYNSFLITSIIAISLIVFFGPALNLLFISYGDHLDEHAQMKRQNRYSGNNTIKDKNQSHWNVRR